MRLNLDRIQRAAENQPQEALNDSCENSCLASFKRSNSGHRGYLSFLRCLTLGILNRFSSELPGRGCFCAHAAASRAGVAARS